LVLINTGELFIPCGEIEELRAFTGIDAQSVCTAIKDELKFANPLAITMKIHEQQDTA
jgi:hypothetical protein